MNDEATYPIRVLLTINDIEGEYEAEQRDYNDFVITEPHPIWHGALLSRAGVRVLAERVKKARGM